MLDRINRRLEKTILIGSLFPGFVFWGIYECAYVKFGDTVVFSLYQSKESLAQLVASYAFTFLGFLLTVTSISLSLPSSYRIKKYKADGYFNIFKKILAITAGYLVIDLVFSILALSNSEFSSAILKLMMVFFVNSLIMAVFSFKILLGLLTKAD